jgi:hypothetical protein
VDYITVKTGEFSKYENKELGAIKDKISKQAKDPPFALLYKKHKCAYL